MTSVWRWCGVSVFFFWRMWACQTGGIFSPFRWPHHPSPQNLLSSPPPQPLLSDCIFIMLQRGTCDSHTAVSLHKDTSTYGWEQIFMPISVFWKPLGKIDSNNTKMNSVLNPLWDRSCHISSRWKTLSPSIALSPSHTHTHHEMFRKLLMLYFSQPCAVVSLEVSSGWSWRQTSAEAHVSTPDPDIYVRFIYLFFNL